MESNAAIANLDDIERKVTTFANAIDNVNSIEMHLDEVLYSLDQDHNKVILEQFDESLMEVLHVYHLLSITQ